MADQFATLSLADLIAAERAAYQEFRAADLRAQLAQQNRKSAEDSTEPLVKAEAERRELGDAWMNVRRVAKDRAKAAVRDRLGVDPYALKSLLS